MAFDKQIIREVSSGFIAFVLAVLVFTIGAFLLWGMVESEAHAWCYTVEAGSVSEAKEAALNLAASEHRVQIGPLCQRTLGRLWQCESVLGQCQEGEIPRSYLADPLGGGGGQWVIEYPSGARLWCEPAFGCRRY